MAQDGLPERISRLEARLERQRRLAARNVGLAVAVSCLLVPLGSRAVDELTTWNAGDPIVASEVNANFSRLREAIVELEAMPAQPPAGTIVAFGGRAAVIPDGWLLCDGRGLSSADYPALWQAIEAGWGDGSEGCDESCDFNLPDLRGRFARGADLGAGRDAEAIDRVATRAGGNTGDTVGSAQADRLAQHTHDVSAGDLHNSSYCPGMFGYLPSGACSPVSFATSESTQTTGETRPVNVAVNYIIKY